MKIEQEKIVKIPEIILKEINHEASANELELLKNWMSLSEENELLYQKLRQKENIVSIVKEYNKIDGQAAWKNVQKLTGLEKKQITRHFIGRMAKYAAIFLIPISIATYFFFLTDTKDNSNTTFTELEKQISQLEESSLIMANGDIVNLHQTPKESVIKIDGAQIAKKDSTLLYKKEAGSNKYVIQYNSLITPKSKVFNVVLSDGTTVWLNASSALKYPIQFNPDTRKVYLTGEAYFEVTKDASRPFIVSTNDMEIEVLGTSFNVMAYPNEKVVETTLVSGSVKVKNDNDYLVIDPGSQAKFDKETELFARFHADTEQITSWRFGKYIFDYENIEDIMKKLARWYNIEVEFTDLSKKTLHFSGTLYKYNDIKETLHIIELATNVKFERNENKIVVK